MDFIPLTKTIGLTLPTNSKLLFRYVATKSKRLPARDMWLSGELQRKGRSHQRFFVCNQYCKFITHTDKNYWGIHTNWSQYVYLTDEEYVLWKLEN